MSDEPWRALCVARAALARLLQLEPGPDIGNAVSAALPLLDAWQRYDGNLYRKAGLTERDVVRSDARIFVVSALFGVIDIRDRIRHYNVAMTDQLPDGRKVNRFWHEHGLVLIIQDLLRGVRAREVHDFFQVPTVRRSRDSIGAPTTISTLPARIPG